jgi:hypothetical protein
MSALFLDPASIAVYEIFGRLRFGTELPIGLTRFAG